MARFCAEPFSGISFPDDCSAEHDVNFNIPLPRTLETPRVKLTPFIPSVHGEVFYSGYASAPELGRYLPFAFPTYSIFLSFIEFVRSDPTSVMLAIIDKSQRDGELGVAGVVVMMKCSPDNRAVEIGLEVMLPAFHRTVVLSIATGIILKYLLDVPSDGGVGFRRVACTSNPDNAASLRAIEKMGGRPEGIMRWSWCLPDGVVGKDAGNGRGDALGRDSALFAICWDDWQNGVKKHVDNLMNRPSLRTKSGPLTGYFSHGLQDKMAKSGGKSSASSATRKKHAKKAAGPSQEEQDSPAPRDKKLTKLQRGQKKKEPRVKVYIPPVKPAPVQPDPLETTGLAHSLPPELLVVLRSFNKKAQVTKIRALEELQSAWIDRCRKEGEEGALVYVLIDMLPVWISPVREQILSFLRNSASPSQIESILGTWCLAAHDIERSVASTALKSWADVLAFVPGQRDQLLLDEHYLPSLIAFIQRAILDPNGVYMYLNPPPPAPPAPPTKKGVRRDEPEPALRSKAEELEESDTDRKARLRIGGLGAIRRIVETLHSPLPDDLIEFFGDPALWSSLYHADQCPFVDVESFGYGQHNVRKSAWGLILSLLSAPKTQLESLLPLLSVAALRSAWIDPDTTVHAVMWQPLLKFLKGNLKRPTPHDDQLIILLPDFPRAWEIERTHNYSKIENDEGSDSETSDIETEKLPPPTTIDAATKPSIAYEEFLRFLELGCSGSPLQGYPTVVIIVSTIPSSILASSPSAPPLDDLFNSFWKVLDGRALSSLQRSATSAAFLSSLFECIVFLIKRTRSDSQNGQSHNLLGVGNTNELTENLVREQFGMVWSFLAEALFSAAWNALSTRLREAIESNAVLLSVFLKVFHDKFKHTSELKEAVASLKSSTLIAAIQACTDAMGSDTAESESTTPLTGVRFLVEMLDQFREGLFDDSQVAQLVDETAAQHAFRILGASPALLLAYLVHRKNEPCCSRVWHALLSGVAKNPEKAELAVKPLLEATQRGVLPRYLKPSTNEVDDLIESLLAQALAGDAAQLSFVQQVLRSPDYFLSSSAYVTLMGIISSTFSRQLDSALHDQEVPLSAFEPSLGLVTTLSRIGPRELPKFPISNILGDIFVFAYLLPACYESQKDHVTFVESRALWEDLQKAQAAESQAEIVQQIHTKLGVILSATSLRPYPADILDMVWTRPPGITFDLPHDVFPSTQELDTMLDQLSPDPIHPSLAVVNPLIPPAASFTKISRTRMTFDRRGFSSYARVVDALLQIFVENRQISKHNVWALQHFQALELYAQDFISMPSAKSEVFAADAIHASLETLVFRVEQVTTYILTSSADEGWREVALAAALDNKRPSSAGTLTMFLFDTIQRSRTSDSPRECRILRNVLQHIFHDVNKDEAERWMLLARKVELTAPETSMAIVFAITNFAPEPMRLDRYRNELSASLLSIPPARANKEGLLTLRKLSASAPNPESDVVFLPQPRAVNITKACQQWIASDEDISEEVVSVITLIFYHIAPILQDIPGAHWELAFDILDTNLEESSLSDDTTLVTLARTLRLIALIQDLASTNKSLRTEWEERTMPILTTVRDLATVSLSNHSTTPSSLRVLISFADNLEPSIPRSTCRGLLLSIVQDLPPSLIDQGTFSKMCHLVMDPSIEVQIMAYRFLALAAKKRTEFLVIEAGVDSDGTVDMLLSEDLLNILQRNTGIEDESSSLKVRSSYIEQLRNLDVIVAYFIPTILSLLRLDEGPQKAFKLDIWAVDEFHVEYYQAGTMFGLQVLGAHLYYRALLTVPSLIHTWVTDCKDRQLSSSITNYTSQCFSPVIIRTEMAHVKSPESTSLLVDENFTIKVASSVNEVVASYSVDEHQLEIKLKIPTDWPLHKIEIKDLKRVGVDENRWRAWILAVQQIIWSHDLSSMSLAPPSPIAIANGRVSELVTLITNAARAIEFHYSQLSSQPYVPSLDDISPHPMDSAISSPALKDAVQILEGACAQLSATVARPSHTVLNAMNAESDAGDHTYEPTALNVVVTFKIPDILQEKPSGMHIAEIGQKAGIDKGKLGRIMRLLASKHIFREGTHEPDASAL
ncbi:hypothetical protein DXG01_004633 [Tephrocybe rancida]|nr:hypothetical protein DXG01_004633 [Tephrocybe rancida]